MHFRTIPPRLIAASAIVLLILTTACENTEEPLPPSRIAIVSGDGQYSKRGTQLPQPLEVKVQFPDLTDAGDVKVRFRSVEGGGFASPATGVTDASGIASVRYSLGNVVGTNRIRAELVDDNSKFVEFVANAGEYFCTEQDPTYQQKFATQGGFQRDLFLFTRHSAVNTDGGRSIAGTVRLVVEAGALRTTSFSRYEEGTSWHVPRDVAFSHSGDLYLAWNPGLPELAKVRPNKNTTYFSQLDSYDGGEITRSPAGVLMGCDERGPFVVGCRDTLTRFRNFDALYSGTLPDAANHDAVAVDMDPQSPHYEDIYYIYLSDNTLRRLPVDSLAATGQSEIVTTLTTDEAAGCKGMVYDQDRSDDRLFLLIDSNNTKAILRITPAGDKTVEYDFFDRGSGNAAGIQNDLAIQQNIDFLYTVDTLNDVLVQYDINQQVLSVWFPDTLSGYDPESISRTGMIDERVGLVVLPGLTGF
jgi:hypothetical protein